MAQRATSTGRSKKERLADEIARAVGAGREVAVETVDFGDPNRPKTCLEVDFPILPINEIAVIEGNAGKPIYQMSKWWARRRSSVFRSLLIAAGMKAPADPGEAAKAVWDVYYANHQKKGAFAHLKVADIFMGGGTTIVEGSRLGMQMYGVDLNPVAWFVVKNEMAKVDPAEVRGLLAAVEAEVKPQIMPFYACDCPCGHKGKWTRLADGQVMNEGFDALSLSPSERGGYRYEGPEVIYVFWAKHGPCQVTGCGHRTPILTSPVVAVKTLTVKALIDHTCKGCGHVFDVELEDPRMAPGVPLAISAGEKPFVMLDSGSGATCSACGAREVLNVAKGARKKVELTLLVHTDWLAGSQRYRGGGDEYGGSATDSPDATAAWNAERACRIRLVEVRGTLPDQVRCPETGVTIHTGSGALAANGVFRCAACGTAQRLVDSIERTGKTAPASPFVIQGFCPVCDATGTPYGGRFFVPGSDTAPVDAANREWAARSVTDLDGLWPTSEIPFGHMTHQRQPLPQHGYTHWWKLFNARQLLVHSQLLRAIVGAGGDAFSLGVREYVLGAFQQYLRNQSMFTLWNIQADKLEPMFANNNYHPKATTVENSVFAPLGRGNWISCSESLDETLSWSGSPWEVVGLPKGGAAKSERVLCFDPPGVPAQLTCSSASAIDEIHTAAFHLVVTDPPFGGNLHYSELSDFFYVWLRLILKNRYSIFAPEYTPKTLEAVSNRARHPDDPDGYYKRLLTECWREANRILKPGGILAFTFHHSEHEPWVAVLESLFEAGFYLEATYPIRSDETKGDGEFGSKKIEYDIVHVCRKRIDEPKPVSWGRMRRDVLEELTRLKSLLEHHVREGLPAGDLHVIRCGKALEYYSRHYGKVFVDETRVVDVRDALLGIEQLLEEESGRVLDPPPVNAEPLTRQLLRIFENGPDLPRDQMQKYLRGTGIAPAELSERGWCREEKKVFRLVPPLEIARAWQGKQRRNLKADYDQAMFLIGASTDGSGINLKDTLRNDNFRAHPALASLLDWHARRAAVPETRTAAARALSILRSWQEESRDAAAQLPLFLEEAS